MIKNGQYRKCERAYLGDAMPKPEIPFEQKFIGMKNVRGNVCEHWVHSNGNVRINIYKDAKTNGESH